MCRPRPVTSLTSPVACNEFGGIGKIALRENEEWFAAGVECGNEAAVDKTKTWCRIRDRRDHGNAIGIRNDHAFDRIGVIRSPTKKVFAFMDTHDARKGVGCAGDVTDHRHDVTDHDPFAAEFARLYGINRNAVDIEGETSTVDGGDHRGDCLVEIRAIFRART